MTCSAQCRASCSPWSWLCSQLAQTAEKVAIFGAFSVYLNFVNLFQFLMMFLGQRR